MFPENQETPAQEFDRDAARRALDALFVNAAEYRSTKAYGELTSFVARFRSYSPFNAMLIYTQMKGARYVAPAHRWNREYHRRIKPGARPIVILQPMGPVMFVFDVSDTEPLPNAPRLPEEVERPFEVRRGSIGGELKQTIENAARDGIDIIERPAGSQSAGSIVASSRGGHLRFLVRVRPKTQYTSIPRAYDLILNANLSAEARYATLVHELAHLYCGHLGTPSTKSWPDRRGLDRSAEEFEAESVCYLVCERIGIVNPSAEYLSGYFGNNAEVPWISIDCVFKAAGLIEEMGRSRMQARPRAA
jgi:hypothetical protein